MAVVTNKSSLYSEGGAAGDALLSRGVIRRAIGTVECAADDSAGSKYLLGRVPSHGVAGAGTFFNVAGWGHSNLKIGTFGDDGALLDTTTAAQAGQSPVSANDMAAATRWWQKLGLAEDPGGVIEIYAHGDAAAAGAGSIDFVLEWIDNG